MANNNRSAVEAELYRLIGADPLATPAVTEQVSKEIGALITFAQRLSDKYSSVAGIKTLKGPNAIEDAELDPLP